MQTKANKSIAELNKLYNDAESCDQSLFAEQRSNVLLAAGDHYTKKHSIYWARIRESSQLSEEARLRVTKNHIHRICSIYINNIFSMAPDVAILAKNDKELHDQKAAELRTMVWQDWKQEVKFRERVRSYTDDFVKVGEVAVKITYNPNAGKFLGYEQEPELDEVGMPVVDELGQPKTKNGAPRFAGKIEEESIFCANLLRMPESQKFGDSCVIIRKMVDAETLKARYKNDPDKLKMITPDQTGIYTVFDGSNGSTYKSKDEVMLREFYYPASEDCPMGYFFITTSAGILEDGELPFGIFPIIFTGFDDIQTTPRKRSIIKQLRPVQAELNRAASQVATHQVTLGDDKLLVQSGTKVSQSSKLPGVRVLTYGGQQPTVLSGRAGEQFVSYIEKQKDEMYEIANLLEETQEKQVANVDPYAELFKSIRHKKKYILYAEKMEHFLKNICEVVNEYAKNYYSDERLAEIFGRDEIDNIAEFRNLGKMGVDIKLDAQGEDAETKMGRQISLSQTLQYVGGKLEKDDIGRILRAMPFTNKEAIFEDYTSNYDNVTNDILALDRGELPISHKYDDHKYIIRRLTNRTKRPGFKHLSPEIQENYYAKIGEHEELEKIQLEELKASQADFIPSGGYLVGCDFYVTDPENPARTRRARIPYESLVWLVKRLEDQGSVLSEVERLTPEAQIETLGKEGSWGGIIPQRQGFAEPQGRPISA